MGIITDLLYIVIAALIGGFLAHFLRQPLIIGYILAGLIVGPHTAGPTVEQLRDIEKLAEIGVALLLFTLGLKVSLRSLRSLSRVTCIMTPMQVLATIAISWGAARWWGLSHSDSLWISATVALSSTMVVLKTLSSRSILDTEEGRMMIGILLAQDIAVIPIMLIVPQLAAASTEYAAILRATGTSLILLAAMYIVGMKLLPRLLSSVSRLKSRELFFLTTLCIALGAGYVSHAAGLSFALGAFVAGMLLSETDFQYQALSDLSGLRDLFGLIFFVSVGMLFDPNFFLSHVSEILVFTLLTVIIKSFLIWAIARMNGYGNQTGLSVGLGLSQIGEFAFVIANAGSAAGQLSPDSFNLVISVAVLSMIATPSLFSVSSLLSRALVAYRAQSDRTWESDSLLNHIVIVGGGTIGHLLSTTLSRYPRQIVVIEADYEVALRLREKGLQVIYGDGSSREILEAAKLSRAAIMIVATTYDQILPSMIASARELNRQLPILVRVHELEEVSNFRSLPVQDIVQPQLEAGLAMLRRTLQELGSSQQEVDTIIGEVRTSEYHLLEPV